MIGVYWGRFNPPHKGHLQLIKKILREVDRLYIAIGSAECENTKRNPFSGEERKRMLKDYLKEEKIDVKKVRIITVQDGKSNSSGVKNLFGSCGKFDMIFTDKATIIEIVKRRANVQKIRRTGKISATQIRDAIANDNKWEHLTGKSTARLIMRLKGIERIKKAYRLAENNQ